MYGIDNKLVKVLVDHTSSVEGPSLAKMLLPKHDVPLNQQYSATETRTNDHGLSPQSHTTRGSNFEKQLTTLFTSKKLTDDLGNFRPGEKLPPPPIDTTLNKKNITTQTNSQKINNNKDESLSLQDPEYAFTDEPNDISRTGFYESTNYDQRPGTFFYPPTATINTPETDNRAGEIIQQRGVISLPPSAPPLKTNQQQQDSLDNAESFIDGEEENADTGPTLRPGSQENLETRNQKNSNPNDSTEKLANKQEQTQQFKQQQQQQPQLKNKALLLGKTKTNYPANTKQGEFE